VSLAGRPVQRGRPSWVPALMVFGLLDGAFVGVYRFTDGDPGSFAVLILAALVLGLTVRASTRPPTA
jgi:hypothetical protein